MYQQWEEEVSSPWNDGPLKTPIECGKCGRAFQYVSAAREHKCTGKPTRASKPPKRSARKKPAGRPAQPAGSGNAREEIPQKSDGKQGMGPLGKLTRNTEGLALQECPKCGWETLWNDLQKGRSECLNDQCGAISEPPWDLTSEDDRGRHATLRGATGTSQDYRGGDNAADDIAEDATDIPGDVKREGSAAYDIVEDAPDIPGDVRRERNAAYDIVEDTTDIPGDVRRDAHAAYDITEEVADSRDDVGRRGDIPWYLKVLILLLALTLIAVGAWGLLGQGSSDGIPTGLPDAGIGEGSVEPRASQVSEAAMERQESLPSYSSYEIENLVYGLIGDERRAAGVSYLTIDRFLTNLAMDHSEDMSSNSFFNHDRSRDHRALMEGSTAGVTREENLAMAPTRTAVAGSLLAKQELAASVVGHWMANPGQRKNILDSSFSMTGLGVVVTGDYVYITHIFQARD